MKKEPITHILDEQRKKLCPYCRSISDTQIIINLGNVAKVTLNGIIYLLECVLTNGRQVYVIDHLPVARICRKCGTIFAKGRGFGCKLNECVKCGYSLIGNVSGVCPECGWKLMRAHKRFVQKRKNESQLKNRDSDK